MIKRNKEIGEICRQARKAYGMRVAKFATAEIRDRLFYSIENFNPIVIHVFGELCQIDLGKKTTYRLTEFTGAYLCLGDIRNDKADLLEDIYCAARGIHQKNMSESEAKERCKSFFKGSVLFGGSMGVMLDIRKCDQSTPLGNFWCEV